MGLDRGLTKVGRDPGRARLAAKALGFYTASTIAFFVLVCLYDPAPHGVLKSWIKRIVITAGFLAVMYGLFAVLLNVFTPREIFF